MALPLPRTRGHVVVAEHEHEIVERVGALQAFGASPRRQPHEPVVVAVGGIVAPAVMVADRPHRQARARSGAPVGAIEHLAHRKAAAWGRTVAFALHRADTAAAERCPPHLMPSATRASLRFFGARLTKTC